MRAHRVPTLAVVLLLVRAAAAQEPEPITRLPEVRVTAPSPPGFSVFLDGVRLNEPTVEEVNFDLIPLEDVERIEVIRGPSVLFGRNTLGGAINLVTRRGREAREIPELA